MAPEAFTVGELAELGGVSRRTVRYYVQEGLIPPPRGLGRGAHYDREHLQALLSVKALQERGLSLEQVRLALRSDGSAELEPSRPPATSTAAARSHWVRVELAPGVELHVDSGASLPSPTKLAELSEWCHQHIRSRREEDHD